MSTPSYALTTPTGLHVLQKGVNELCAALFKPHKGNIYTHLPWTLKPEDCRFMQAETVNPSKPIFGVPAPPLTGFFREGKRSRKGEPAKNEWVSEMNGEEWIAGPRYIRHYHAAKNQVKESKALQDYREGKWCEDPVFQCRFPTDSRQNLRDPSGLHHDMRFVERPQYNPLNDEANGSLRARFDVTYIFEVNNQGRVERRVEEYGLIFILHIDPHDPRSRAAHEVGGGQQVVAGPVNG